MGCVERESVVPPRLSLQKQVQEVLHVVLCRYSPIHMHAICTGRRLFLASQNHDHHETTPRPNTNAPSCRAGVCIDSSCIDPFGESEPTRKHGLCLAFPFCRHAWVKKDRGNMSADYQARKGHGHAGDPNSATHFSTSYRRSASFSGWQHVHAGGWCFDPMLLITASILRFSGSPTRWGQICHPCKEFRLPTRRRP